MHPINGTSWILDTGASWHMTGKCRLLKKRRRLRNPFSITLLDGKVVWANSEGQIRLSPKFILRNVLFVPRYTCSLISIGKLTKDMQFCLMQDLSSRMLIGVARWGRGLVGVYRLRVVASESVSLAAPILNKGLWHRGLGHPSSLIMKGLSQITDHDKSNSFCDICVRAKMTRTSFPNSTYKATNNFDLVYCDVCGLYTVTSIMGVRCFLTIMDDKSRSVWIYLMKGKFGSF